MCSFVRHRGFADRAEVSKRLALLCFSVVKSEQPYMGKRGKYIEQHLYHCYHRCLSGGDAARRVCVQQIQQRQHRLLKMGPLVTAMSAEASDMSSWLLMGMPGLAYLTGIASPGWTAIGLAVGTWLNWLIVARRLRRYSANLDAITVPQFLSLRFHDQRNLLNALGAVIIIVFFIPYTASGFAACGKLFHSLFGVDYMAAMILSAWSSWVTPSWAASAR